MWKGWLTGGSRGAGARSLDLAISDLRDLGRDGEREDDEGDGGTHFDLLLWRWTSCFLLRGNRGLTCSCGLDVDERA